MSCLFLASVYFPAIYTASYTSQPEDYSQPINCSSSSSGLDSGHCGRGEVIRPTALARTPVVVVTLKCLQQHQHQQQHAGPSPTPAPTCKTITNTSSNYNTVIKPTTQTLGPRPAASPPSIPSMWISFSCPSVWPVGAPLCLLLCL